MLAGAGLPAALLPQHGSPESQPVGVAHADTGQTG